MVRDLGSGYRDADVVDITFVANITNRVRDRDVLGDALFGGVYWTMFMVLGVLAAACLLLVCWKCSTCKLRDCRCIKFLFRCTGSDAFDDFEVMILVHDVTYTRTEDFDLAVRIRAGDQETQTDSNTEGVYQQPLSIFVEQGTEHLDVELIDYYETVYASLKVDVQKEILMHKQNAGEKVFAMKQCSKSMISPKVKLSIVIEEAGGAGPLSKLNVSNETDLMLRQQLHKVEKQHQLEKKKTHGATLESSNSLFEKEEEQQQEAISELELLCQACHGPIEKIGGLFGSNSSQWVTIERPPASKKFKLCFWDNQTQSESGKAKPNLEILILKIQAVQPDPARSDVFSINYLDDGKTKNRVLLRRVDRGRDVWVEMLTLMAKLVHEYKKDRKCQTRAANV